MSSEENQGVGVEVRMDEVESQVLSVRWRRRGRRSGAGVGKDRPLARTRPPTAGGRPPTGVKCQAYNCLVALWSRIIRHATGGVREASTEAWRGEEEVEEKGRKD